MHVNIADEVRKLQARPGDIVVVTIPGDSSDDDARAVADACNGYLAEYPDVFLLVLPEGCSIANLSDAELNDMGLQRLPDALAGKYRR